MSEQQNPKQDKKISLAPLTFDEVLKGLPETEPPNEKQEKQTPAKRRKRSTEKASDNDTVK